MSEKDVEIDELRTQLSDYEQKYQDEGDELKDLLKKDREIEGLKRKVNEMVSNNKLLTRKLEETGRDLEIERKKHCSGTRQRAYEPNLRGVSPSNKHLGSATKLRSRSSTPC